MIANRIFSLLLATTLGAALSAAAASSLAQATRVPQRAATVDGDEAFLAARDAFRANDRAKLDGWAVRTKSHPLASYVEAWQLTLQVRGNDSAQTDAAVAAFFARYPDSYVAERLRLDWLLARGARGDFANYERDAALLLWNQDDAQLRCYRVLARHLAGDATAAGEARRLLLAGRENGSNGCLTLAETLLRTGQLDGWEQVRTLVDNGQYATARRLGAQIPGANTAQLAQAIDKPAVWLAANERSLTVSQQPLALIALARLARDDPAAAARSAAVFSERLMPEQRGIAWGRIGHMAAVKLMPEALDWYRNGGRWVGIDTARADEVLEWQVRAALRGNARGPEWVMVREAVERMSPELQRDPAWVYWRGRALAAEGRGLEAAESYRSIATGFHFYGKLAAEELGQPIVLPPRAPAASAAEVAVYENNAGLARALKFYDLNLRGEGIREWNWVIRQANEGRGMSDRQLLALAEYARSRGVLDRMISVSERTREEFDFTQRFPAPYREQVARHAQAAGLDETFVYGLIRQESRFITDVRSSAGAQGLMQLMPATARYVARKNGVTDYQPARVTETDLNLKLGTSYLRMVLDALDGHAALASAAYNAGPGRPRAWRASLPRAVEGAIFAETIPFNETRDYVKKVLSNSVYYAALLQNPAQSLKARLGTVAPKEAMAITDLP
jgi:soluble lytic murein transglycosylase